MEKLSRVNKYEKQRNEELELNNILEPEEDVKVFKPRVDNGLTTSFEKTKILKRVQDYNQNKPSTDETDIDILKRVSLNVNTYSQTRRSKESFEDMFLKPSQREKDIEIKNILEELNKAEGKPKTNSTVELQTEHVKIEDTLLQNSFYQPKPEQPKPQRIKKTKDFSSFENSYDYIKPTSKQPTNEIYKRELKEIEKDINSTNKSIKWLVISLVALVIMFFAYVMAIMTGII